MLATLIYDLNSLCSFLRKYMINWAWWCMLIFPTTQEVKVGGSQFEAGKRETSSEKQQNQKKKVHTVESLHSKHRVFSPNPNVNEKEEKKE
jgi:hypothetical protein